MNKLTFSLLIICMFTSCNSNQSSHSKSINTFSFSHKTVVLGNPKAVFDTLTGNIKPWWDHTFSPNPDSLFIQAYPGGGFYEYFDNNGNGVRHALVTAADRGNILRLEGPLGLAGNAINLVSTISLDSLKKDSTIISLDVHASGEIKENWPDVVEQVWSHFINDRLKPYLEGNLSKE